MSDPTPIDAARARRGQPRAGAVTVTKARRSPIPFGQPTGDVAVAQARLAATAAVEMTGVPAATEAAMAAAGMDNTASFAPGRPIDPFFGTGRPPRQFDFRTGANLVTRPREEPGRVGFSTLKSILRSYDVAQICGSGPSR